MPDVKEVVNGLEMSYKYSNVDENNTLVPQWIVLHAIALLKEYERAIKHQSDHLDALLKAQEPRVMTIQEIKNADFCYLEVNGHDGVTPVLLKHFIDDKYIHVTINGGSVYFFDITCDVEKLVRCWTSRPTDEQRQAVKWND